MADDATVTTVEVPDDLSPLSNAELDDLAAQINDQVASLAEDLSEENVSAIESLGEAADKVSAEMASREKSNAELQSRVDAVKAKLPGGTAQVDTETQIDEPAADVPMAVETPAETAVVTPAEEAPVTPEPLAVETDVPETPAPEASEELATTEDPTPEVAVPDELTPNAAVSVVVPEVVSTPAGGFMEVEPARGALSGPALLRALTAERSTTMAPVFLQEEPLVAQFVATSEAASISGVKENEVLDLEKLADFITRKRHGMGNVASTSDGEKMVLASAQLAFDPSTMLTGDAQKNFGIIYEGLVPEVEALVASGGNCALAQPRYEIFRLAEPQSPVEDNLPTLPAPRGSIRWVIPPDFRDARGGVGLTTCEEDANQGDTSGEGLKPCVHVECPDADEACVTAVSSCVEFGNLSYRTFPEQVQAFLLDLAVNFASVKEVLYLDAIDDASTAVTISQVYGATRSVWRNITKAAVAYRKRNSMNLNAVLDWYIPDWMVYLLKTDMVADQALGMNFLNATDAQVISAVRQFANLNLVLYYDSATGEGQAFSTAQSAGTLNDWPDNAVTYLHAPGTFARMDAGTLDVGLIRDSALNRTNDLQIFSEQWVQVIMLGIEAIKLTFTGLCPTGQAPALATALTC